MRVVSFYFVREISAKERFHKDYEKIVGDDAAPIMPQAMAKVVKETPRDREVIDTLKKALRSPDRCRHANRVGLSRSAPKSRFDVNSAYEFSRYEISIVITPCGVRRDQPLGGTKKIWWLFF